MTDDIEKKLRLLARKMGIIFCRKEGCKKKFFKNNWIYSFFQYSNSNLLIERDMDFKLRRHSKFLFWLLKKILKYPTSEKRDCSDLGLCILQKVKSFECSIFGSIVEKTRNYKRRFSIPCESFFSTRFNSTRKV